MFSKCCSKNFVLWLTKIVHFNTHCQCTKFYFYKCHAILWKCNMLVSRHAINCHFLHSFLVARTLWSFFYTWQKRLFTQKEGQRTSRGKHWMNEICERCAGSALDAKLIRRAGSRAAHLKGASAWRSPKGRHPGSPHYGRLTQSERLWLFHARAMSTPPR